MSGYFAGLGMKTARTEIGQTDPLPNGTLYIGVTDNIARRVWEHKQGLVEGLTKRYSVHTLVYCESFGRPRDAIQREKRLKKWNRAWKIQLIESTNPGWKDLYETVMYMP